MSIFVCSGFVSTTNRPGNDRLGLLKRQLNEDSMDWDVDPVGKTDILSFFIQMLRLFSFNYSQTDSLYKTVTSIRPQTRALSNTSQSYQTI